MSEVTLYCVFVVQTAGGGFRVQRSGFLACVSGFKVQGSGFGIEGLECRVQGLGLSC